MLHNSSTPHCFQLILQNLGKSEVHMYNTVLFSLLFFFFFCLAPAAQRQTMSTPKSQIQRNAGLDKLTVTENTAHTLM